MERTKQVLLATYTGAKQNEDHIYILRWSAFQNMLFSVKSKLDKSVLVGY